MYTRSQGEWVIGQWCCQDGPGYSSRDSLAPHRETWAHLPPGWPRAQNFGAPGSVRRIPPNRGRVEMGLSAPWTLSPAESAQILEPRLCQHNRGHQALRSGLQQGHWARWHLVSLFLLSSKRILKALVCWKLHSYFKWKKPEKIQYIP